MRQAHRALCLQSLHSVPTPCPLHTLCPTSPLWAMQLICTLEPERCQRCKDTGLSAPELWPGSGSFCKTGVKTQNSQCNLGMTAPETVPSAAVSSLDHCLPAFSFRRTWLSLGSSGGLWSASGPPLYSYNKHFPAKSRCLSYWYPFVAICSPP